MRDEPSFEDVLTSMEDAMGEDETNSSAQSTSNAGKAGADSTNGAAGSGPLTPAEQVAILDARLEQRTGEFDAMILGEQNQQRSQTRSATPPPQTQPLPEGGEGSAGSGEYGKGMTNSGAQGGGIGGAGGGSVPQNTAKYPPPDDIPSGNDDDVVARQLREAAMREPDPAIREKLWEEYRKYKGIK